MGAPPVRVDLMRRVSGVDFPSAWSRRIEARRDEILVPVISLDDLVSAKKAAGRPQDRLDLEELERSRRR